MIVGDAAISKSIPSNLNPLVCHHCHVLQYQEFGHYVSSDVLNMYICKAIFGRLERQRHGDSHVDRVITVHKRQLQLRCLCNTNQVKSS